MGKNIIFLGFIAGCFLLASCKKDRDNRVPEVPVEVTLLLDLPAYSAIQNPGGWVYITEGSMGLIVYRATMEEFTVLDRHCTWQVEEFCQVSVDSSSSILAQDFGCCNSVFSIIDGSVVSSPAERPLEMYNTMFNPNANSLRIYN